MFQITGHVFFVFLRIYKTDEHPKLLAESERTYVQNSSCIHVKYTHIKS